MEKEYIDKLIKERSPELKKIYKKQGYITLAQVKEAIPEIFTTPITKADHLFVILNNG